MKLRVRHLAAALLMCAGFNVPVLAEEQGSSPLQSRPDEVRQTQEPRPGYYQDIPRRNEGNGWRPGSPYHPQGSHSDNARPPVGARVSYLPDYARQVWIGDTLFFVAAGTYYRYLQHSRDYLVVNPPRSDAAMGDDVIAYPAAGQSPQQLDRDRYECHRWAMQQSGFDPADVYRRAMGACLSGRGYSVN